MKKQLINSVLCVLTLGMFSCRADVDIANIDDPTVKLGFGAALPVGEVSMRLGDFLGDDVLGEGMVVREDGVLCFYDSLNMEVGIDEVDVTEYFGSAHAELVIGSLIPEQLIEVAAILGIPLHWKLGGSDEPIVLECPIEVGLGGINQPGAQERIDKAIIAAIEFGSRITVENMDMPFNKIESVELTLPDYISRSGGQVVLAQLEGKDYGQKVPVVIDNCVLDLVKDHSQPLGLDNVRDTLSFGLRFTLNLEKTDTVTIYADSKFVFDFSVDRFDYDAVFGYFNTSGLSGEKMELSFADMLPIWNQIGSFKMPFTDPRIDLAVTTGIGAPLAINIDEISTTDRKTGQKARATFDGKTSTQFFFSNLVQPDDPLDAVVRNEFHLSKDPSEGHIDQLFTVEPEKLEFSYGVCIKDTSIYPQMRITDKTSAKIEAEVTLPLEFNEGLDLEYTDTLGVNISSISLDSLIKNTPIDSLGIRTLQMVVKAKNTLPFNIQLTMKPLNEEGNEVMTMQPLLIAAPTEWDEAKGELIPGTNTLVINVTEEKLGKLSEVKTLLFTAKLCDKAIADGMNSLPAAAYPIGLSKEGQFSFNIGIAADLDAYMQLDPFSGKEK